MAKGVWVPEMSCSRKRLCLEAVGHCEVITVIEQGQADGMAHAHIVVPVGLGVGSWVAVAHLAD